MDEQNEETPVKFHEVILGLLSIPLLFMIGVIALGLLVLLFCMVVDMVTGYDLLREVIHPFFRQFTH